MDKLQAWEKVQKLLMIVWIITMVWTPAMPVQAAVKGLTLDETSVVLTLGETIQLEASTRSSVKWSTEDKKIAAVNNGLVTAMGVGTVNIKAQSGTASAVCKVTVYKPAEKVKLVIDSDALVAGDPFTATANISPVDATYQSLIWSVDDGGYPVVEQISKNKFRAVDAGTAKIVAYQKDTDEEYSLEVEVKETIPFHMEINNQKVTSASAFPGGRLIIQGVMEDGDYYWMNGEPNFKYSVKDKSIASVDERGQITALKTGSTDVLVTAQNGKSKACRLTVSDGPKALQTETFYAGHFLKLVNYANYGEYYNTRGADSTYIYKLAKDQIGVFRRMVTEEGQKLEMYVYDQKLNYISKKDIPLPYHEWGGLYQGEDGNYYAAVGQKNEEEDSSQTVFSIVKMDGDFNELGRCNITGGECITVIPYDTAAASMTMSGTTLIVHTDRERYQSGDGLNHQSNISFVIDTTTMKKLYVGTAFPYNHVSHSFAQFVKMDGSNLIYVDHGDAYPRSVVMQTHYNFAMNGWNGDMNRNVISALDLLKFKGAIGDNYTGTTVNGFEIGLHHNLVAGISIPHESLTEANFMSYKVRNAYVSLVSKDGRSSQLIWLTDYKDGEKTTVESLRMLKISEDKFALIYPIRKGDIRSTALVLMDSNGTILQKKEYNIFYTGYTQPLYYNGSILWIDSMRYAGEAYWEEDEVFPVEQSQFTRIYLE
jgi:uncharacterized protein YjdB